MVGRTPWSAADALVGLPAPYRILMSLFRQRDEGVPRGPGVRPSNPAAFRLLAFLDGHYAEAWRTKGRGAWRRKVMDCATGAWDSATAGATL